MYCNDTHAYLYTETRAETLTQHVHSIIYRIVYYFHTWCSISDACDENDDKRKMRWSQKDWSCCCCNSITIINNAARSKSAEQAKRGKHQTNTYTRHGWKFEITTAHMFAFGHFSTMLKWRCVHLQYIHFNWAELILQFFVFENLFLVWWFDAWYWLCTSLCVYCVLSRVAMLKCPCLYQKNVCISFGIPSSSHTQNLWVDFFPSQNHHHDHRLIRPSRSVLRELFSHRINLYVTAHSLRIWDDLANETTKDHFTPSHLFGSQCEAYKWAHVCVCAYVSFRRVSLVIYSMKDDNSTKKERTRIARFPLTPNYNLYKHTHLFFYFVIFIRFVIFIYTFFSVVAELRLSLLLLLLFLIAFALQIRTLNLSVVVYAFQLYGVNILFFFFCSDIITIIISLSSSLFFTLNLLLGCLLCAASLVLFNLFKQVSDSIVSFSSSSSSQF